MPHPVWALAIGRQTAAEAATNGRVSIARRSNVKYLLTLSLRSETVNHCVTSFAALTEKRRDFCSYR
jgi:hypothetical protein